MAKTVKNWAKHYADVQAQQQRGPAQNASRVLPAVLWDQYPDGKLPAPQYPDNEHQTPDRADA